MLADDKEKGVKDKAYRAPDYVYYFQYLFLSENNRVVAFINPQVPDITFDAVNQRLKKANLASKDLDDQQCALGRAKRFQ